MPNEPHAVETSGPVTPPPMPSAPGAVKGAATAVAPPFAKASPRALDRSSAWLKWRLNRLRCMTPAEISHRVVRTLSAHAERAGLLVDEGMPEPALDNAPVAWVHSGARVEPAGYLAAADRIASGRLDVFALSGVELGSPPRWNRDPRTGVEAPLTFGKLLDYRDPRRVGDIKYLWEVNRHLHIVTLAQAYALSGDPRYFAVIREHIESWLESCPVGLGPNWSSSLEVSIRLINWSVAWQFLGGALSPMFRDRDGAQFRRKWLAAIFRHAQFVRRHFSLHSSANNHLIGEAAGLFVAGLTWPCWPQSRAWIEESEVILEREALLQNAPDGVNREQAVAYQQFTLDLLLIPMLAAIANRRKMSSAYGERIEAMMEFLASIMDAGGNVPAFGDSDDALVVKFAPDSDATRFRSLLASGALLFGRGDFKAKAGSLDDKTRWLFGIYADAAFHALAVRSVRLPVRRALPWGGYYILGCDFETPREIRLVADAGPLGYQAIAAHGHADALSFTLSMGGMEFLIDPGTYAYHTHRAWRDYFRGTSAHNTVRIDGMDQSQSGGNFMWLKKANARCELWTTAPERDVFDGWHDGYTRLPDPVIHRRRITLDKSQRRISLVDRLEMQRSHDVELMFHCSERCSVERTTDGYLLRQMGRVVKITLPRFPRSVSEVHMGSISPILGWVSRKFDEKEPSPTIIWRARITGAVTLRTEIECDAQTAAMAYPIS